MMTHRIQTIAVFLSCFGPVLTAQGTSSTDSTQVVGTSLSGPAKEADANITALLATAGLRESEIRLRLKDIDIASKQSAVSEARRHLNDSDIEINALTVQLNAAIRNNQAAFRGYSSAVDDLSRVRAVPPEMRQKAEDELAAAQKEVRRLEELVAELNRVRAAVRSVDSINAAIGESDHLLGAVQPPKNSARDADAKKTNDIGLKPERRN